MYKAEEPHPHDTRECRIAFGRSGVQTLHNTADTTAHNPATLAGKTATHAQHSIESANHIRHSVYQRASPPVCRSARHAAPSRGGLEVDDAAECIALEARAADERAVDILARHQRVHVAVVD